jgi:hypothetical protein
VQLLLLFLERLLVKRPALATLRLSKSAANAGEADERS